ncbi:hypothetical protein QP150_06605 [Sphingomonas sp. 22L2VL55-3]
MRGRVRLSVLALLGLTAAGPAVAACKVSKIAELPVTLTGRRAMVDAKFGTHDTRFIVDSGAFYSTVSRASAAEFGLSSEPAPPGSGCAGSTATRPQRSPAQRTSRSPACRSRG